MQRLLTTTALLSILLGAPAFAQTADSPSGQSSAPQGAATSQQTQVSQQDRHFAKEAALSGMAEVELGKIAGQKAANPQVKQFGDRMVKDHWQANDKLRDLAKDLKIDLPKDLDAAHKQTMDELRKLSGAEFNKRYIGNQVEAHETAIKKFEQEGQSGRSEKLKTFAQQTLPILKDHLQQAQNIQRQIGKGGSQTSQAAPPDQSSQSSTDSSNADNQQQASAGSSSSASGPDIKVQQPPAHVTVQQPAPQVTVTQPQPNVTVQQPEPKVTVNQPKPDVTVQQAKPDVTVKQAKPDVKVQRADRSDADRNATSGSSKPPNKTDTNAGGAQQQAALPPVPIGAEAQNLIGKDVYGQNGKDVGDLKNLLIGKDGRVQAAVIEFGGFLGLGENQVAVDWNKLNVQGDRVTVNMTEDEIKSAPHWNKDRPDGHFADAHPLR